jgi:hypothetical protein
MVGNDLRNSTSLRIDVQGSAGLAGLMAKHNGLYAPYPADALQGPMGGNLRAEAELVVAGVVVCVSGSPFARFPVLDHPEAHLVFEAGGRLAVPALAGGIPRVGAEMVLDDERALSHPHALQYGVAPFTTFPETLTSPLPARG